MDFYYILLSAPCRAVLMTAKALGIELNKKYVDMRAGGHLTPEYLKLNPQHCVPTLVDGDFSMWESRAIIIYLVEKYGKKDNSLYPSCPKKRALINQRLYFDMGTMYKSFADYFYPHIMFKKPADPEALKKLEAAFEMFNTFLEGQPWAAGDTMTLADLSLFATVSTVEINKYINFSKYANVSRWYANMKQCAPGADENMAGCKEWLDFWGL